ncbi:uncharacterized protein E6C27_scaffold269G00410 [Cucumis melo var. makuwa]|uniref:Uncharacterized protein n=1 Tax=Cucumis melo var. makuwa TaxID=1194695 RepID=A0A5A7SP67_CUCMM|nr:uncharacterized protein E6C27_scaffold269G00410 [Cucumis melo var. makuwa]
MGAFDGQTSMEEKIKEISFSSVVASAVGPISLDLVTKERRKLSYACVCVDLGVDSHMLAEITEEDVGKVIPSKGDDLASVAYGDVVLKSFQQLEEGEIRSSPNRLVVLRRRVTLNYSRGSLPPLQVDDSVVVSSGLNLEGGPVGVHVLDNSYDYYNNSGVDRIWVIWKRSHFAFSPRVGDVEDFNFSIHDANVVESLMQGNWFTWTSKDHGSSVLRRLDRILVNDEVCHEGVSPLVNLMRNLEPLKSTLYRHLGRHIQCLNEEVCIAKESMDKA